MWVRVRTLKYNLFQEILELQNEERNGFLKILHDGRRKFSLFQSNGNCCSQ